MRIVDGQVVLDESSLVVANIEEDRTVDYSRLQENTGRVYNYYLIFNLFFTFILFLLYM